MLSTIQNYFKDKNLGELDVTAVKVIIDQCYEIMEYYINNSEDLVIRSQEEDEEYQEARRERQKKIDQEKPMKEKYNKIKSKLKETVKIYEDMLKNCDNKQEAEILQQTLSTLQRQLMNIDSAN